jgi:hypothetical protein
MAIVNLSTPKDDGCFLHPSCINCPENPCIFEYPGGPQEYLKDKQMRELLLEGRSVEEIAQIMGVHQTNAAKRKKKVENTLARAIS